MAAKLEVELHPYGGTRARTIPPDRLARAAGRGRSIERPRNRLENGRFAGAVRADDAGQAGVELDERVGVLPKVAQAEGVEAHSALQRCRGRAGYAFRFTQIPHTQLHQRRPIDVTLDVAALETVAHHFHERWPAPGRRRSVQANEIGTPRVDVKVKGASFVVPDLFVIQFARD